MNQGLLVNPFFMRQSCWRSAPDLPGPGATDIAWLKDVSQTT